MTATQVRRIAVFSLLAVLALGAVALTGFWHPNAPEAAMQVYLPKTPPASGNASRSSAAIRPDCEAACATGAAPSMA